MKKPSFIEHFAATFESARFEHLARESKWQRRAGKIDAFEFLAGLVFGQTSALRLTLSAQAACCSLPVSRQAIDQRYKESAVAYFRASFDYCLKRSLAFAPPPAMTAGLSEKFPAIHLVDSTAFDAPASFTWQYPGCGGVASAASVKVLLRYEYLSSQFVPVSLLPGKRSDQGLAGDVPSMVGRGELLLADKAFVKLQGLQDLQSRGAYYLLPWPRKFTLWELPAAGPPQMLDLLSVLRASDSGVFESPLLGIGTQANGPQVRLIAFRLSEQSASRARAGLRKAQQKQGRTPSAEALELAGWLILITNAPPEKLPTDVAGYLYRVRWQIELVFKQCKSVLRIHSSEVLENISRFQCEIWARLIAALVIFSWHGHLQSVSWAQRRAELSFAKVARELQIRGLSLAEMFIAGGERLRNGLRHLWNHLLTTTRKDRRSRQTTWKNLQENWLIPMQT